jgi:hypothetical protein
VTLITIHHVGPIHFETNTCRSCRRLLDHGVEHWIDRADRTFKLCYECVNKHLVAHPERQFQLEENFRCPEGDGYHRTIKSVVNGRVRHDCELRRSRTAAPAPAPAPAVPARGFGFFADPDQDDP